MLSIFLIRSHQRLMIILVSLISINPIVFGQSAIDTTNKTKETSTQKNNNQPLASQATLAVKKSEIDQFIQQFVCIYYSTMKKASQQQSLFEKSPSATKRKTEKTSTQEKDNQTIVSHVTLAEKKSDTKQFIKELVHIYHSTMKKIDQKQTSNLLADKTDLEILSGNGNYSISLKIILENDTIIKIGKSNLYTFSPAYTGGSENVQYLLNETNLYRLIPRETLSELKDDISILLYNEPDFIKRYYNRMWRTYRRPDRITLGSWGGVNFSTAFVSPFDYSDETEQKTQIRRENEAYLPAVIFGFSAGYSHRSHGVDLFYQHTNYGCKYLKGNQINWLTGFYGGSSAAADSMKLRIPVNQFGIRYRYSNYKKTMSPYTSVGIHLLYVNQASRDLLRLNSRYLSTGCNLALGLNIHPIYALDIHIAPVMNISFNAVKKSELQTRFSSISLEVGVNYHFTFIDERYKTGK